MYFTSILHYARVVPFIGSSFEVMLGPAFTSAKNLENALPEWSCEIPETGP